jgi:DNA invertase Pin-like site-specific DNA recombinase
MLRQYEAIKAFLKQHDVSIPDRLWFEDRGWARDFDKVRPRFNDLLACARQGKVRWIIIDSLDRFGAKSVKRLFGYLGELEDAGCLLYDCADGREWTSDDDGTEISAWVAGKTSSREQREKSKRTLGGMLARAKAGEWLGGPPKLGFDVGCFDRATGKELWRVVFEGRDVAGTEMRKGKLRNVYHIKRKRVYPDGRTERLDGNVVFRTSKDDQVLRIVPSQDKAKLAAVKELFRRYATEAVAYFALAKWLNSLGITNSFGKEFQGQDVAKMLTDQAYLGFPTFRGSHDGGDGGSPGDIDGNLVFRRRPMPKNPARPQPSKTMELGSGTTVVILGA